MSAEEIRHEMLGRLEAAGLAPYLVRDSPHVQDLGDELFVEIVLLDRTRLDEASGLARQVLKTAGREQRNYSLVVRPKWEIKEVGGLAPAYGPSGGLRAATLVPVTLRSGDSLQAVTVSVTKLAEAELDYISGRKSDLREVAKIVVDGALRRGGSSSWDPTVEDYLEVASGAATNISRMLKRTA